VLAGLCDPTALAIDERSLYIANYRASAVLKIPKPVKP
jgi:hypothetical protein